MFTFAVITYNQQDVVLETLESIKYQIENFSFGLDIQLVIADDGSIDNTVEVIQYWISKNDQLFKIINISKSKENIGISGNYVKAINLIKGSNYKVIAGDDVFSKNNIFETEKKLEKNDFCITSVLFFNNYKIIINKEKYQNVFLFFDMAYSKIKKLYEFTFPFYIQGVFHKIELLDKRTLNYIQKFKMVEDHPELYFITQNNDSLNFSFSTTPYILYRESESAITKSHTISHNILYNDIKKLYKMSMKKERNIFLKYIIWCSYVSFQNSKIHYIIKFINPFSYYKKFLTIKNRKKINTRIEYIFEKEMEINQKHIEYLKEKASELYREYIADISGVNSV